MKPKLNCVLLIDDDEPTNFLSRINIEEAECAEHIQIADSGSKALDYIAESNNCPDLIFLDINMPAMNGWEFIEQYKKLKKVKHGNIIIIMLTTSLNPDDRVKANSLPQIAGFENKPLTPELINKVLNKHFSNFIMS